METFSLLTLRGLKNPVFKGCSLRVTLQKSKERILGISGVLIVKSFFSVSMWMLWKHSVDSRKNSAAFLV